MNKKNKRNKRSLLPTALVLAISSVLASCGGSDGAGGGATSASTDVPNTQSYSPNLNLPLATPTGGPVQATQPKQDVGDHFYIINTTPTFTADTAPVTASENSKPGSISNAGYDPNSGSGDYGSGTGSSRSENLVSLRYNQFIASFPTAASGSGYSELALYNDPNNALALYGEGFYPVFVSGPVITTRVSKNHLDLSQLRTDINNYPNARLKPSLGIFSGTGVTVAQVDGEYIVPNDWNRYYFAQPSSLDISEIVGNDPNYPKLGNSNHGFAVGTIISGKRTSDAAGLVPGVNHYYAQLSDPTGGIGNIYLDAYNQVHPAIINNSFAFPYNNGDQIYQNIKSALDVLANRPDAPLFVFSAGNVDMPSFFADAKTLPFDKRLKYVLGQLNNYKPLTSRDSSLAHLIQDPAIAKNLIVVAGIYYDPSNLYRKATYHFILNRLFTPQEVLTAKNQGILPAEPVERGVADFPGFNKDYYFPAFGSYQCGETKWYCLTASYAYYQQFHHDLANSYQGFYNANFGTSFSAPIVTAVAAMVKQQFPWMTASNLQDTILTTATDVGSPGVDDVFGWGVINAANALRGPAMFAFGDFVANLGNRPYRTTEVVRDQAARAQATNLNLNDTPPGYSNQPGSGLDLNFGHHNTNTDTTSVGVGNDTVDGGSDSSHNSTADSGSQTGHHGGVQVGGFGPAKHEQPGAAAHMSEPSHSSSTGSGSDSSSQSTASTGSSSSSGSGNTSSTGSGNTSAQGSQGSSSTSSSTAGNSNTETPVGTSGSTGSDSTASTSTDTSTGSSTDSTNASTQAEDDSAIPNLPNPNPSKGFDKGKQAGNAAKAGSNTQQGASQAPSAHAQAPAKLDPESVARAAAPQSGGLQINTQADAGLKAGVSASVKAGNQAGVQAKADLKAPAVAQLSDDAADSSSLSNPKLDPATNQDLNKVKQLLINNDKLVAGNDHLTTKDGLGFRDANHNGQILHLANGDVALQVSDSDLAYNPATAQCVQVEALKASGAYNIGSNQSGIAYQLASKAQGAQAGSPSNAGTAGTSVKVASTASTGAMPHKSGCDSLSLASGSGFMLGTPLVSETDAPSNFATAGGATGAQSFTTVQDPTPNTANDKVGYSSFFVNSISGRGGLIVYGNPTPSAPQDYLFLTGDNTYEGPTIVNSGNLVIVSPKTLGISDAINIQAGVTSETYVNSHGNLYVINAHTGDLYNNGHTTLVNAFIDGNLTLNQLSTLALAFNKDVTGSPRYYPVQVNNGASLDGKLVIAPNYNINISTSPVLASLPTHGLNHKYILLQTRYGRITGKFTNDTVDSGLALVSYKITYGRHTVLPIDQASGSQVPPLTDVTANNTVFLEEVSKDLDEVGNDAAHGLSNVDAGLVSSATQTVNSVNNKANSNSKDNANTAAGSEADNSSSNPAGHYGERSANNYGVNPASGNSPVYQSDKSRESILALMGKALGGSNSLNNSGNVVDTDSNNSSSSNSSSTADSNSSSNSNSSNNSSNKTASNKSSSKSDNSANSDQNATAQIEDSLGSLAGGGLMQQGVRTNNGQPDLEFPIFSNDQAGMTILRTLNLAQYRDFLFAQAGTVYSDIQFANSQQGVIAGLSFMDIAGSRLLLDSSTPDKINGYASTRYANSTWDSDDSLIHGKQISNGVTAGAYTQVEGYNFGLALSHTDASWHENFAQSLKYENKPSVKNQEAYSTLAYAKTSSTGANLVFGAAFNKSYVSASAFFAYNTISLTRSSLYQFDQKADFSTFDTGLSVKAGYQVFDFADQGGLVLSSGLTLVSHYQEDFSEQTQVGVDPYHIVNAPASQVLSPQLMKEASSAFAFKTEAKNTFFSMGTLGAKLYSNFTVGGVKSQLQADTILSYTISKADFDLNLKDGNKTAYVFDNPWLVQVAGIYSVDLTDNLTVRFKGSYDYTPNWQTKAAQLDLIYKF